MLYVGGDPGDVVLAEQKFKCVLKDLSDEVAVVPAH